MRRTNAPPAAMLRRSRSLETCLKWRSRLERPGTPMPPSWPKWLSAVRSKAALWMVRSPWLMPWILKRRKPRASPAGWLSEICMPCLPRERHASGKRLLSRQAERIAPCHAPLTHQLCHYDPYALHPCFRACPSGGGAWVSANRGTRRAGRGRMKPGATSPPRTQWRSSPDTSLEYP